jgi:hypothetical protein
MSDATDSQNRSEIPIADILEADTSPDVSISDDGERSTPSGMPPAATRTRRHRNSSSEDEDFVVEEVTSKPKRQVVAKEQQGQQSKKGTSKVKASATAKRKLSLEEPSKVKKTSKRKRVVYVQGSRADMFIDPHADAEEGVEEGEAEAIELVQKQQKLMADAMKTANTSKAKKPAPAKPKKTIRNIPATEKNKENVPIAEEEEEEEEAPVLQKLRPRLPTHIDVHPVAENMKLRKDRGLRLWRHTDPYVMRRRTIVDNMFHTRELHDFYETVLMDKKPVVADMRYVD